VLESSSQNAGHQPPDGRAQETARRSPEEQTRVQATPVALTSPEDYALLATVFLTGLGSVIALARRRHAEGAAAIPPRDLPALALATFALADTVAKEKVSTWLRQPFVEEDSDHHPLSPKGHGMQRAVGELLTCTRWAGTWGALVLVGLAPPRPSRVARPRMSLRSRAPTISCKAASGSWSSAPTKHHDDRSSHAASTLEGITPAGASGGPLVCW